MNTTTIKRSSGRGADELRTVTLERGVARHAEGSCLIKCGETHVLSTASLQTQVPRWIRGLGKGWVTAEYGLLPRSTHTRTRREASTGRQSGRTLEIQRLIGRSLRAVVDLHRLGEVQIILDCDVLQADGGTRTAAITAAWVALHDCIEWMMAREMLKENPLGDQVAAISCGLVSGAALLDLDYEEDSGADIDANFVITGAGGLVEVQCTAEGKPFSTEQFNALLGLARQGTERLLALQKLAVA